MSPALPDVEKPVEMMAEPEDLTDAPLPSSTAPLDWPSEKPVRKVMAPLEPADAGPLSRERLPEELADAPVDMSIVPLALAVLSPV
jgi:hypothetical protein